MFARAAACWWPATPCVTMRGAEQKDFALAKEMGVKYESVESASQGWKWRGTALQGQMIEGRQDASVKTLVRVRPTEGETLLSAEANGRSCPLLHLNRVDRGKVAYLASLDRPELTQSAVDWLAGPLPVTVTSSDKQAILTYQEKSKRWVLHLLSDGPYTLHLAGAGPTQVVSQYPADHWSYKAQLGGDGLQRIFHYRVAEEVGVTRSTSMCFALRDELLPSGHTNAAIHDALWHDDSLRHPEDAGCSRAARERCAGRAGL